MKRALLVAFHFPPVKGSSGVQRALKISRYLREGGWDCDVLTVWPRAYQRTGDDEIADIPHDVDVVRAFALDAKRHLSLFGKYPSLAATPDRWASWYPDGVRRGRAMLKRRSYDLIWSTYPIATAHRIALALAATSGLPWVADCRDTMSEPGYPSDPRVFRAVRKLEHRVVHEASAVTFTAPGARDMYAQRYPQLPASRWRLIQNGYDEQAFTGLSPRANDAETTELTLVHAGILYPNERDPLPFFRALANLKSNGFFDQRSVRVVLRATGHDDYFKPFLREFGIGDIVHLAPGVPYRDALQEMIQADGLLIFQAANCNHQIPAKAYEYLRAGRPIMALTDPAGDTARLLADNGVDCFARLDDQQAIEQQFVRFVEAVSAPSHEPLYPDAGRYSRRAQTLDLAALFNELIKNQR
jgi:hypothetical protein